ncbi:YggT family protein [Pontivivens ytuae]|uniref:YggT family protein n=1 Tax=Pontivivens ytuae TaxID=2789856 RepID=A0A7S9LS03_9RHOB|nr:YggT family protein [Pontivivens ytuae]QPH54056.1 YggT family protein [Pontivivens ytuae]
MNSIADILLLAIDIAFWIVLIHIIMSWLITFNVLNMSQPLVYQIWSGLNRLLEPIYGPIRRVLPNTGGLDLAPLIFIFGLYALEIVIRNNILAFA